MKTKERDWAEREADRLAIAAWLRPTFVKALRRAAKRERVKWGPYLRHKFNCFSLSDDKDCKCGLAALLKEQP